MNTSSITPVLPLTATPPVTGAQGSRNTENGSEPARGTDRRAAENRSEPASGTDRTQLTKLGELMSKLQDLEGSDPAKANQVLTSIASSLTAKANSAGTTDPHLQELADKFTTAANNGDLSGLTPHGGHHHQAVSQAAPAPEGAQVASSYTPSGGDAKAQLDSIISNALSSATA